MKRAIILFIISIPVGVLAQNNYPDSINSILHQRIIDTTQVDILNTYANNLVKENPSKARELINQLLEHPAIIYLPGRARALTILGNTYWSEGAYPFALRYYLLSAREYETVNDSIGLSKTYNNIGEVYKKIKEYDKSLQYLLASLNLVKSKAPLSLYNVGELYLFMKNYSLANKYFQSSLALAIEMDDSRAIAYCYWGLGKIKTKERNYDQAIALCSQSLHIWEDQGDIRARIQLHQELGHIYTLQRKFSRANESLEKAKMLANTVVVPDLRLINYSLAYSIDSAQGNLSNAFKLLLEYNELKDSIYNLQNAEQITRLQAIYETEVRVRENRELKLQQRVNTAQLKNQQIIIISVSAGLIISAIMAVFLFRQQRQILRANKTLASKNEKIISQNDAIQNQALELKKLNLKLTDLNKNLETRIEERTRQLSLQNQKLTDYTFVNAHKLRAPVATILGLINLLNSLPENEIPIALAHLKNCGEQLDHVIRDISADLEGGIFEETND